MSMYGDYVAELLGDHVTETEKGFATYRFCDEKTVYILNIYVAPQYRKKGVTGDILDLVVRIAKERGCTKLLGSVVPSAKGSTVSLKMLLAHGMKLQSSAPDFILFEKEI